MKRPQAAEIRWVSGPVARPGMRTPGLYVPECQASGSAAVPAFRGQRGRILRGGSSPFPAADAAAGVVEGFRISGGYTHMARTRYMPVPTQRQPNFDMVNSMLDFDDPSVFLADRT